MAKERLFESIDLFRLIEPFHLHIRSKIEMYSVGFF